MLNNFIVNKKNQNWKKKMNTKMKMLLMVFIFNFIITNQQTLWVIPQNTVINTITAYDFYIVTSIPQNQGTNFLIYLLFPPPYFFNPTLTLNCFTTQNVSQKYTCNQSNNKISINYTMSTTTTNILVSVSNITNPSCVQNLTVIMSFSFDSSNVSASNNSLLSPGFLAMCSVNFASSFVNQVTTATFNITTGNGVDVNGGILLIFPKYWNDTYYQSLNSSSGKCNKISGSWNSTPLNCSLIMANYSILLSSAFTSSVNGGQTFTFSIDGIFTPANANPGNKIDIRTFMSNSSVVDFSSCSIFAFTPQAITLQSDGNIVVGSPGLLNFNWYTSSTLYPNDILSVLLPAAYTNVSNYTSAMIQEDGPVNGERQGSTSQEILINVISNRSGQLHGINFNIYCLIDTSPRNVNVSVYRNGYLVQTGILKLTPIPNNLLNVIVSTDVQSVSDPMSLNITFTNYNPLPNNSHIEITVPPQIPSTKNAPLCTLSSPITSNFNCTLAGNKITTSIISTSVIPPGTLFILKISNAFTNPTVSQPTSPFLIQTMSPAGYPIDQSSTITYKASPGTIAIISITPASYKVIDKCVYILSYNLARPIIKGSIISVTIPTQIQISSLTSFSYSINTTNFTIAPSNSNRTFIFSGIFTLQPPINSTIKIYFSLLVNPNSFKPTSSFAVNVTYNGYETQSLTSSLSVTMNIMASFNQISPIISNPTNGAKQDYSFVINPLITINKSDILTITIQDISNGNNPLFFMISKPTFCYFTNSSGQINVTCNATISTLTMQVTSPLLSGNQYILVVSPIILARTFLVSSNFNLTSQTSDGYYVQTTSVQATLNDHPNLIQFLNMTVKNTPSQLNKLTQMQINLTTFNGLIAALGEYIVVDIPTQFTYVGTSPNNICLSINTTLTCTINYPANNNSVIIHSSKDVAANTSLIIQLSNLYVSPTNYTFEYFSVTTYTKDGSQIDITDTNQVNQSKTSFYLTCNNKCKTCDPLNASYCLSCYDTSVNDELKNVTYDGYNIMYNNECVNVCPDGQYNDSNSKCTSCIDPCVKCTDSSSCTSCKLPYFYQKASPPNNCVMTCKPGSYGNNSTRQCSQCSSFCATCLNTSTYCLSCSDGLFLNPNLNSNQCVANTSCPNNTYANKTLNQCKNCIKGCDNCSSDTNCTLCHYGYVKPQANSTVCQDTCPPGTANYSGTCGCNQSCKTCQIAQNNCLTCLGQNLLFLNHCLPGCPANTYQPTDPGPVGRQCVYCPSNCVICNTDGGCTTCTTSFLQYNGKCYTNCPDNSRPNNNICQPCIQSTCKTCPINNASCTSCFSGYLLEGENCTIICSQEFVNFNEISCLTECPIGYYNDSGKCQMQASTEVASKIVPFPYIITYVLLACICLGVKCLFPETVLSGALMSVGSIVEVMSLFTITIIAGINSNQSKSLIAGLALLIIGLIALYAGNIVNMVFVFKVLNEDKKFFSNYSKTQKGNIAIRVISVVGYFKFHEIVFSNIFGVQVFCSRVESVLKLHPFDILLGVSAFLSVWIVIGSSLISYSVQEYGVKSSTFIQSIDCIVVVVLNLIPTILIFRRKSEDYEKDINSGNSQLYLANDQGNNLQNGEFVMEEGGGLMGTNVIKVAQSRNKLKQDYDEHHLQNPLYKKKYGAQSHPITALKNKNREGDPSIQQLSVDQLNQLNSADNQIEQIVLNNDIDPKLLELAEDSPQFKKLPKQLKKRIREIKKNKLKNKSGSNSLSPRSPRKNDFSSIDDSRNNLIQDYKKKKQQDQSKKKFKVKKNKIANQMLVADIIRLDDSVKMSKNQSQKILSQSPKDFKQSKSQIMNKKSPKNDAKFILKNQNINEQQNQHQQNQQIQLQQDQPILPTYNKNQGISYDNDKKQRNDLPLGLQYQRHRNSANFSENLDDKNINNFRNMKGQHTVPHQQSDILPRMRGSENLNTLLIINKNKKNENDINANQQKQYFEHDESSISKKIFYDDSQTLKSAQGDNIMLDKQISPSHFNIQNQRFDQDILQIQSSINNNQDDYDEGQQGHVQYQNNGNKTYDLIIQKRNSQRLTDLQKIYLPRLQEKKFYKKKN